MYRFVRGVEPNSYIFFTDNAVVYDVFFVKVDYFYQYPIFADNMYELVIKAPTMPLKTDLHLPQSLQFFLIL